MSTTFNWSYELCSHQSQVLDGLRDALNHSVRPACFFEVSALAMLHAHPECPEQVPWLGENAVQFCDVMLSVLGKHLEAVLLPLWDVAQRGWRNTFRSQL